MKSFILYTSEGSTYSPENVLCENFQILGFAQGESQNQACDLFLKTLGLLNVDFLLIKYKLNRW